MELSRLKARVDALVKRIGAGRPGIKVIGRGIVQEWLYPGSSDVTVLNFDAIRPMTPEERLEFLTTYFAVSGW